MRPRKPKILTTWPLKKNACCHLVQMTSLYWLSWKWNGIFKYLKVSDTEDNQILSLQSWNLVSLRQKERTEYIHLHFYFFFKPWSIWMMLLNKTLKNFPIHLLDGTECWQALFIQTRLPLGVGGETEDSRASFHFGKGEQSYPTSEKSSHFWHINRHASCILFHKATNESEVFLLMLFFQLLENPLYHSVPGFQN